GVMQPRTFSMFAAAAMCAGGIAFAQSNTQSNAQQEHWVATWAASMLATNIPQAPPPQAVQAVAPAAVSGQAPAAAPAKPQPLRSFNNQTVRMVLRTSIGGRRIRVTLDNTFGTARLKIGAAHVALRDHESSIIAASDHILTFGGSTAIVIPAGAVMLSDPVDLNVPALGYLAVSVYVPEDSGPPTQHGTGLHTTYISGDGDFSAQPNFTAARTTNSWYFLSSVDVLAAPDVGLIVAYGDSITDGATSTNDTDASWPSGLAKRLAEAGVTNLAVVNQGISGNRVLRDGTGINALARLDRDVLAQPGVKYLMLMEGINDIGQGVGPNPSPANAVTSDELIAAYRQVIDRAHLRGIKVIGCTLTPYEGAGYYSEAGEAIRSTLNQWILTSGAFDGTVDFEKATRDPEHPRQFLPGYNIRDHLHPNDAGYNAMAQAIDLSLFGVKKR
ncbi:MAG TPA: SGNH/GDSL hydrolase family protein, partial [Bryobacteraceae bacterium]